MIGRNLFNIFLTALLVAAVAFFTAPWFAFRALKAATTYEDVAAISELVDFGAVRSTLTQQLKTKAAPATAEPPSLWRDPVGAFRHAIEPLAPPEPAVDRYLTTAGLAALTRGYAPGAAPPKEPAPTALPDRAKAMVMGPYPTLVYWDPNRVRISIARPDDASKVTLFTWQRRGWFVWKLVGVTLPESER